ncbi:MAG: DUF2007 domain-containing protein [Hellea sp.]|nr:DUF2007 domain-containing protein [Hellea sp.]
MLTIIATTNPVTLSFAEAVLKSEGIESFIMDQHQSLVDGSIGIIPRRICVLNEDYEEAVAALEAAELGHEIYRD